MEVRMEDSPVTSRLWKEWVEKDKELSSMTDVERLNLVKGYQFVCPKTKNLVELESLYSSRNHRRNRDEFKRWFYVVCGYMMSRVHLGDNSYYQYERTFKKQFLRDSCTSKDFPKQVLLALAILGYITELGGWYIYNPEDKGKSHGYHFNIDRERLMDWGVPPYASTVSAPALPEWVTSQTRSITFEEDGSDYDSISWTMHPDWLAERQYESICSAEIAKDGIEQSARWMYNFKDYQYFYNLTEDEQKEQVKEWRSYQKLRDLDCGIVGGCKTDTYAGRFYSPMTNMKGEHRHRYLRLEGELVTEVDVSSAQPTFLGIMLYRQTGIKSEWLRQALAGTFYEWIKEKTSSSEDRDTIKTWMMQYMYSCYQPGKKKDYAKPHKPTYEYKKTEDPYLCFQQRLNKFLQKNEPAIYKTIDWYKRNPEYREDKDIFKYYLDKEGKQRKAKTGGGKWCSNLSKALVEMEVEYIKRCIRALPEDMPFWTIHDCICVKESDSLKVKSIMEEVSREMYGEDITLRLKRENTSQEYS